MRFKRIAFFVPNPLKMYRLHRRWLDSPQGISGR